MKLKFTLHSKFLVKTKIQSSGTLKSMKLNLYGNGISSGQNIYTWHAYANRDSHANAESLPEPDITQMKEQKCIFSYFSA